MLSIVRNLAYSNLCIWPPLVLYVSEFAEWRRSVGCQSGGWHNCGPCLIAALQAVETLVPPIRIERTTNGLGMEARRD
jgi:hypothetical protein